MPVQRTEDDEMPKEPIEQEVHQALRKMLVQHAAEPPGERFVSLQALLRVAVQMNDEVVAADIREMLQ
jgi:hypothetical protein